MRREIFSCVFLAMLVFLSVEAQPTFLGTRCSPCRSIDIIFALENDDTMGDQNFANQKEFIKKVATSYKDTLESGRARIGVTRWDNADVDLTTNDIPLTGNYTDFLQKLDTSVPYEPVGGLNVTDGLLVSGRILTQTPNSVTRVIVLLTNGHDNAGADDLRGGELSATRLLVQQGTFLLLIAVGTANPSAAHNQYTLMSGLFNYTYTNYAVPSWDALATDSAAVTGVTQFLCSLAPLPGFLRPVCPLNSGFKGLLKAYPPGNYALGTFIPSTYTTWGFMNIPLQAPFPLLSLTLEFWVMLKSSPQGKTWTFISSAASDNLNVSQSSLLVLSHDGQVRFVVGNGGVVGSDFVDITSTAKLQAWKWYHIVVSVEQLSASPSFWGDATDRKFASLRVNGELWGSQIFTLPTFATISSFQVGRSNTANLGLSKCDCVLDEIKFWNQCQSSAKLASRVNKLATGSEANLQGYWNFEDISQLNFPDLSSNRNPAVPIGTSPWIVQLAENNPKCTNANVPNLRDFETSCNDPKV